jgi:hypothetical protein
MEKKGGKVSYFTIISNCCASHVLRNFVSLLKISRLRVFENRVLRKIFELKREKVAGERRKLHNE